MDLNLHRAPPEITYYPSPPSHGDHQSLSPSVPTSHAQHMAVPYAHHDPMPPPPKAASSADVNGASSTYAPGLRPSVPGAAPAVNGHVDKVAPAKQNRLSKACDGCSVRKVKCDEEGPPCRACRSLQIPCTFNRPSRRRGPPNRHAEAIKKQKLEFDTPQLKDAQPNGATANNSFSPTNSSSLGSPGLTSHSSSALHKPHLTVESLCPLELVMLLVDDFFSYMHPLHPFPHEPSFRHALFTERRDARDPHFLALVASMIGMLVSCYPRCPLKRLKELHLKYLFRSSSEFITRCRDVALEARGFSVFSRRDVNIYDAVISYFLAQIATNTFNVSEGELYFGECFNMLRALGYQRFHAAEDQHGRVQSPGFAPFGQAPSTPQHTSLIDREIALRLYWSLYQTVRAAFAFGFGSGIAEIQFNPSTPIRRHPPFPLEVDDDRIHADYVEPQPPNTPSTITALNHLCRMHIQYEPIKAFKLAWIVDEAYDIDRQNAIYRRCMGHADEHFNGNMPTAFRLAPNPGPTHPSRIWEQQPNQDILSPSVGSAPHFPGTQSLDSLLAETAPRRTIGLEIQKANVHMTFLATRTFYLEKFWNSNGMNESVIGMTPEQVAQKRLNCAKQLLDLMNQVHPIFLEPNALGLCMQIRQIASTLYTASQTTPRQRYANDGTIKTESGKEEEARVAGQYVQELLKISGGLEKRGRGGVDHRQLRDGEQEWDEEEELRAWADLRGGETVPS